MPSAGCTHSRTIRSGVRAATSSISMPPAWEAMTTWVARARSSVIERYSSRSTAEASSTSTERTRMPSGGVCGVFSLMPRICRATRSAPSASSASLMPPALPRPPACTCAFTTIRPPRRVAAARASAGVVATSPTGTGTPNSRSRALAWYSWIFTDARSGLPALRAPELLEEPHDGIERVGGALLERDDPVVGDVDVLGADLGAALGDVAEADPRVLLDEARAVTRVQRMHVEARDLDEEARPGERALLVVVVANHVAHVLAQEALDALVELLNAIDILLHHPVGAGGLRRLEAEGRHLLGLLVVEGHVGDEVADQREGPDRRHRDRVARLEQVHPRHAHEPGLAVDLGAARAALAGLAVPATGEVVGLSRLDLVDHVEDDHALLGLDAIVLEAAGRGVAAEHPHRELGHRYFLSWKSALSSAGISGSGSRLGASAPPLWRVTTLVLPQESSVDG